jgi:hypothetical protein
LNSVHNLHLKEASGELLRALCGWLNSDVCARIYRELSGETRREFPQVHIATMRLLPVPHALFLLSDRRTQQLAHIVKLLEETTDAATDFTHPLRVELEALCQALFEKPTGEA